ncbi:ATP-binding protein [Helicobacter mustelae]|uniref:Probable AAA family ATPase n=1 Tax=Helicobacter mustelae (strain ATCC 43772 / CCUG 25715 / CIP 103759 / LMG 18044 / NCTC 12198 / R85-136P) TaxID=679897 RepID=D3UHN8_HELM1|nr:AAA family ATPase [Helicobacter mustelae]CBG40010.1 probable AAA family ATPase [Helicobacter mustelae 12198]SQH71522.1 ATPase AAA [Helicobacter mustelae]STP12647.1 ATPase AAA [Helicobacter mustelae]
MQNLLEFLHSKNLNQTKVFRLLECDEEEAKILHFMLQKYFSNDKDFEVSCLLKDVFEITKYEDFLPYLSKVKNLLELGWISEEEFKSSSFPTLLEILHAEVALTPAFFKLLEESKNEAEIPEITPYEDHFEYLKDQFCRISLLQKLSHKRLHTLPTSGTKYHLKAIEEKILARLKLTKTPIPAHQIIQENKLNAKEEILFFALLKEEYFSGSENLGDMNTLIDLISHDEYERIKNRMLFDEKSTLIERKIFDYEEMYNSFGGISKTFYLHEDILQKILRPKLLKKPQKISLQNLIKEQQFFEILEPKMPLEEIVMPQATRQTLSTILEQQSPKVAKLLKHWGIKDKQILECKIIFYGPSGTGKTLTALGMAKNLKKQVLILDCSKVLSMYVGESEKNVRKIFDNYKEIAKESKNPPILLLDEADQFLSVRISSRSGAEKMHNQMQNIFLEQIEKFEGILIATTNLLETIDNAFSRRFNHKIEFKLPSENERILLWQKYLPKNAKFLSHSTDSLAKILAKYDLSGGQIALVVKNTAYGVALKKEPLFEIQDFILEIQKELRSSFDREKSMGFVL